MNATQEPFFTSQALHNRYTHCLSALESANGLSPAEKQWLQRAVEAPSPDAPGRAYNLFLSRHQCRAVHWTGALLLNENVTADSTVFLFTPLGTLERFANQSALHLALQQRLDDVSQQAVLLHFTPVDVRPQLIKAGELTLQTQPVQAPVMQHTSQAVVDYLARCREETLGSLVGAPSLRAVLDAQLRIALEGEYPGFNLDPLNLWVRSSKPAPSPTQTAEVITTTLSSTALDFYCKGQLPARESREFLSFPASDDAGAASPEAVEQRVVRVMLQATEHLAARAQAALAAYWQAAAGALPSPHDYCVARLGDLFYHQGLQALHDGLITREQFDRLQRLGAGADPTAQEQVAQLSVFDPDRGEVALCGLLGIFYPGRNTPVFSFSGAQGLIKHDTRAHFKTWVLSRLRDAVLFESIAPYIPADQHELITAMVEPRLSVENVCVDAFSVCVQSIQARQSSDFSLLLKQFRAGRIALAGVDHALDVRELIDQGLLGLNSQRRWSSRFVPGAYGLRLTPIDNPDQASQLSLKLAKVEAQRDGLLRHWPTPRSFARLRLAAALARAGHGRLDAAAVVVQTFALNAQQQSLAPVHCVALIDALLERVTGAQPLPANPALIQAAVRSTNSDELKVLKTLGGTKVLTVLDHAATDFNRLFTQHLRSFFLTPFRPQGPDALLFRLATLRMALLRADLRLMRLEQAIGSADSAVLANVLVQPVSHQRTALDQFVPDVFGISLSFNGPLGALTVVNCLLFTERGGLESDNAGRAIVWTPAAGFEGFESVDHCTAHLEARLLDKARRWELLAHVNVAEQWRVSTYLDGSEHWKPAGQNRWFYFERIDQDFTVHAQVAAIDKVLADADFVCRSAGETPLSAQGFENSAQSLLVQGHAGVMLERVMESARLRVFKAALPDWLKTATPDDQQQYAQWLQRYQAAGQSGQSYLHGIPEINDFSRALLTLRLKADFRGQEIEPDAIEVESDTYLAAPVAPGNIPSFLPAATARTVQSLTQFALSGFARLNADTLFVRGKNGGALPPALNTDYLRHMVRKLDIGGHYLALLQALLAPGSAGADGRQQQFARHLGLQVIEQAFREKLIDFRRETAYRYLRHVMEMPDGSARLPLDGVAIIIRPLELIAEPGSEPDRVSGMYLVGPASTDAGPQILWANYSERFTFKVCDSDADLLDQLRTDTDLQGLILSRIAPYARRTYANGGFVEPHLPRYIDASEDEVLFKPAAPTLAYRPIGGNLFKELYKDNYQLLRQMAMAQSTSTAQAHWESFKYLLSLLAQTALMFLPARLSIPLVVWQSLGSLRAGVEAAKQGEWGEAVGDFALTLMMAASSKPEAAALEPVVSRPTPELSTPEPSVVQLSPEQQAGLQPFAANDVALVELLKHPDTHLYSDLLTGFTYASLAGQVFRLVAWRERWRIFIGEQREGPLVRLNEHQQWVLDTREPLLGGGPVYSKTLLGLYSFAYDMNAVGMSSIQRRFPDKALKIQEAHALASTYLQRCQSALHTLNEAGAHNASNRELLEGFFNVERFDGVMLARLNQTIEPMLARFLHPDMSPRTSGKYVVCRARFADNAVAFVNISDPSKLIYLTGAFFETLFEQPYALTHRYLKRGAGTFAVTQHYRASFLLHEVSHQVLGTEDIMYTNPGFPYADLLDEQTSYGTVLLNNSEHLQAAHSPYISLEHLFQGTDSATQQWVDIPRGAAKARIKKIAGVPTLAQARLVFRDDPLKRIDMMLANADSVVLLINELGRIHPKLPQSVG